MKSMRWFAPALVVVAVIGLAGCSSAKGSGGAKSSSDIVDCLHKDGFATTLAASEPFQFDVNLEPGTGASVVQVTIQKSEKDAKQQAGDEAAEFGPDGINKGGGAISQGDVVLGYAKAVPASALSKIKSCAF